MIGAVVLSPRAESADEHSPQAQRESEAETHKINPKTRRRTRMALPLLRLSSGKLSRELDSKQPDYSEQANPVLTVVFVLSFTF